MNEGLSRHANQASRHTETTAGTVARFNVNGGRGMHLEHLARDAVDGDKVANLHGPIRCEVVHVAKYSA